MLPGTWKIWKWVGEASIKDLSICKFSDWQRELSSPALQPGSRGSRVPGFCSDFVPASQLLPPSHSPLSLKHGMQSSKIRIETSLSHPYLFFVWVSSGLFSLNCVWNKQLVKLASIVSYFVSRWRFSSLCNQLKSGSAVTSQQATLELVLVESGKHLERCSKRLRKQNQGELQGHIKSNKQSVVCLHCFTTFVTSRA
jgi:hypothetical protein